MRLVLIILSAIIFGNLQLNAQPCTGNSTGNIPIPDLQQSEFLGFMGGKYPNGLNAIPIEHFQQGSTILQQIKPLDSNGEIDSINGKMGVMVLGFSTAAMTGRFVREMLTLKSENPHLQFFIGAQGGRDINSMTNITSTYWTNIDSTLNSENLTRKQVQIIWLSSGDIYSSDQKFPDQCYIQIEKYRAALANIKLLYPNCKMVYLSDRTYAGYVGINGEGPAELKEPTAYYNGWTIKWLIENQILNKSGYTYSEIPYIDWGPYLWTDGNRGNSSGYTWDCDDAGKGGIHPSSKGRMKEAALVYIYFKNHPLLKHIFY